METVEKTTITDHSSEVLETSSEVLEELALEDDLTAILRSKDALIKTRNAENQILQSIVNQHQLAIANLRKALEVAERRFSAIEEFMNAAQFSNLSVEQLEGICITTESLANDGVEDCLAAIDQIYPHVEEKISRNREG